MTDCLFQFKRTNLQNQPGNKYLFPPLYLYYIFGFERSSPAMKSIMNCLSQRSGLCRVWKTPMRKSGSSVFKGVQKHAAALSWTRVWHASKKKQPLSSLYSHTKPKHPETRGLVPSFSWTEAYESLCVDEAADLSVFLFPLSLILVAFQSKKGMFWWYLLLKLKLIYIYLLSFMIICLIGLIFKLQQQIICT